MKVGNEGPTLTHLQFADDTLVFCNASVAEIQVVKKLLGDFEEISGLKINYHKTIMCGIGLSDTEIQSFALSFGCQALKFPIKYLGMPLGANPKSKATWKPVIDKFKAKLATWKRRYLSFGGRITLIKSVLCSLPIYFMSLFRMPKGVVKCIESIQSKFLWGGSDLKRKLHMVAWAKITQGTNSGGLGIRDISYMNDALLMKWWWRYGTEKEALWRQVIKAKYDKGDSNWFPNSDISRKVSKTWKDIIQTKEKNPNMFSLFISKAKIGVGDGKQILFWTNPWLGNQSLADAFPSIFRIICNHKELLCDVLKRRAQLRQWEFQFRRRFFDWESDTWNELLTILDGSDILVSNGTADKLTWGGQLI